MPTKWSIVLADPALHEFTGGAAGHARRTARSLRSRGCGALGPTTSCGSTGSCAASPMDRAVGTVQATVDEPRHDAGSARGVDHRQCLATTGLRVGGGHRADAMACSARHPVGGGARPPRPSRHRPRWPRRAGLRPTADWSTARSSGACRMSTISRCSAWRWVACPSASCRAARRSRRRPAPREPRRSRTAR